MNEENGFWTKAQPYYRRIYEFLLEEISSGRLVPGDRVPSEKELCNQFGVSRITSKKALELLSDQGLVTRFPGKGSFVADNVVKKNVRGTLSSRTIGLLIPDFSDSFGTTLIYGIEETSSALGYHLIFKLTRDSIAVEEAAIAALADDGAAGILVLPVHGDYYNSEILKAIVNKYPLVFVDRTMRGLAAPSVSSDNVESSVRGVEYLLKLGHRNIAFYSGPTENTSTVEDRKIGFMKAFTDNGMTPNPELFCLNLSSAWTYPYYDHSRVAADFETVRSHLRSLPEISAAFATEYSMAQLVKNAAESIGRSVPDDFSILSFDAPPTIAGTPPFTYIMQDEYMIGKRATEALHHIIGGGDPVEFGNIKIQAKLVEGASTAPKR
jgi:DNA-binding LacI/PurR family transcriptional regulator